VFEMKYVSRIGHQLVNKNKLHKAVSTYLKSIDRMLINDEKELEQFKDQVLSKILELNTDHARCKPLHPSWHEISYDNDIYLSGVEFCLFHLHQVKQEFEVEK